MTGASATFYHFCGGGSFAARKGSMRDDQQQIGMTGIIVACRAH
jgi:hypothetical protein